MADFTRNLKSIRESKKMSQGKLGELIGESQQTVGGWERGRSTPNPEQIKKMAAVLNCAVDDLLKPEASSLSSSEKKNGIAYYGDIDVTGGPNELFLDGSPKPSGYIQIPNFEDCDMAFPLFGDSMSPKYKSGQIILCKEFKDWRDYVPFGEVFLIITDSLRTVKYVKKGAKSDLYLLVSENEHFEPFEMPISKVKRMFFVKGAIQRDIM